jgi:YggT family protein
LALFIQILAYVLLIAILIRVIFSWTGMDPSSAVYGVINEITEPILAPIRQLLPRIGMMDLSPMAASILLIMIAQAAQRALA